MLRLAAILIGSLAVAAPTQDSRPQNAGATAAKTAVDVPFFGNAKCPVTGKDVDKTKMLEVEGQPVYFCCGKCLAKAKTDSKGLAAKAYPADKVVVLKNATCPISDEKNEDSKETITVAGHTMRLCCKDCSAEVTANWAAALTKASDAKLVDAHNKKCPTCGKDASGKSVVTYKNTIVRLAAPECADEFKKDPDKGLAAATKKS